MSEIESNFFLDKEEKIQSRSELSGGNMNAVYRVRTNQRDLVLKKCFDYVKKYPDIAAPIERITVEVAFYRCIKKNNHLQELMPQFLDFYPSENAMLMEYAKGYTDGVCFYEGEKLSKKIFEKLFDYLKELRNLSSHHIFSTEDKALLENKAMRELNRLHIFELPFDGERDAFLKSLGLEELASYSKSLKDDAVVMRNIKDLSHLYMTDGDCLLHGDYYPGSWLVDKERENLLIIDPEFCFLGKQEFDLGVFFAHLKMSDQENSLQELFIQKIKEQNDLDESLIMGFAAIEILRRFLGVAQLPLSLPINEKKELIHWAQDILKNP